MILHILVAIKDGSIFEYDATIFAGNNETINKEKSSLFNTYIRTSSHPQYIPHCKNTNNCRESSGTLRNCRRLSQHDPDRIRRYLLRLKLNRMRKFY